MELLGSTMTEILTCVRSRLTTPVNLATLAAGTQAVWDDCCNGQLWALVSNTSPVADPAKADGTRCFVRSQINIQIGVIRCAVGVLSDRGLPSAIEMTADALSTYQDRLDILEALECCVTTMPYVQNLRVGNWTPLGPNAGCVGGQWSASFRLDDCYEC